MRDCYLVFLLLCLLAYWVGAELGRAVSKIIVAFAG